MTHIGNDESHDSVNPAGEGAPARPLGWVGAAFSVAVFVGIAIWGYELAVRDVGDVPVVRALEGPMRVRPEDPGGQQASHQGLTVNRLQEAGLAQPAAERLILAPEPIGVIENDSPVAPPRITANPALESPEEHSSSASPAGDTPETPPGTIESVEDLLRQVALDVSRSETFGVEESEENAPAIGLAVSPRPAPRPDPSVFPQAITRVESTLQASSHTPENDAASIPTGTLMVQLGAFDSPEAARTAWEDLQGQFGQYFEGRSRVVQHAESGGRAFYRLRATGFADLSDAQGFCSVLLADGSADEAPCIPAMMR